MTNSNYFANHYGTQVDFARGAMSEMMHATVQKMMHAKMTAVQKGLLKLKE